MPVILASWDAEIRAITVGGQPGQTVQETPISKITSVKWAGGMVDSLLCKCEAMSSNSSPSKKKRFCFLLV
jgi:hypothetical protein